MLDVELVALKAVVASKLLQDNSSFNSSFNRFDALVDETADPLQLWSV